MSDGLSAQQIKKIAYAVMDEDQKAEFKEKPEMNLALIEPGYWPFPGQYIQTTAPIGDGHPKYTNPDPEYRRAGFAEDFEKNHDAKKRFGTICGSYE